MDELQQAQESLGRTLDRARAGEDPALAGIVREKGEQAVNLLYGLLRMSRIHAADNAALHQPVTDLWAAFGQLVERLGTLHLVAVSDQVYVNEIRIRTPNQKGEGKNLATELAPHNVGGLTFTTAPSVPQLRALLMCLNARPAPTRPRASLKRALLAAGVDNIEPALLHRFRLAGEELDATDRLDPQAVVTRAIELVEETWDGLAQGRSLNMLPLRRVVTDLLELGPGHDELWWTPPWATPHGLHSLRVCQYALLLGQGAGLSAGLLQDLGVAALVHDLGAATSGGETHARAGSLALLGQLGFHEGKIRRVLAVLDHHREIVETVGGPSTLFGRILHICEDYDNLVREDRGGVSPALAIGTVSGGAGSRYDPVLYQALVNRLGRYPPGTLLRLADRRVVRCVSTVRTPETFERPRAVVVRGADGRPPPTPQLLDLASEGAVSEVLPPR